MTPSRAATRTQPAQATVARCLVIGGSGALGGAVCRAFAKAGARIAFTYCENERRARALVDEIDGARTFRLDVRQARAVEDAVGEAAAALLGLDALVYCAARGVDMECVGEASAHRIGRIDEAAWDELLSVNLRGAFFACRAARTHLAERGGNLVLVGSVDGVKPIPSPVHYATSKAALTGMTRALAKEVGARGIRVNLVAPGLLEDGLTRNLPKDLVLEYEKHCGLKRRGRLDEAANVIAWLALENTYVTGQCIVLDGAL